MLCFAYKWLGESTTKVVAINDFENYAPYTQDDFSVVKTLWHLFDEADVVVAHNGDKFDQKVTNARFLYHSLRPPSPYRTVDTLKTARRYFRFNSNKLGDLATTLGLESKGETGGFQTWLGCLAGDQKAWRKMATYNKQDVVVLEQVYKALRPWMSNHPGVNRVDDIVDGCPKCGSADMSRQGFKHSQTAIYQQYRCNACGGWSRERTAEKSMAVKYVN